MNFKKAGIIFLIILFSFFVWLYFRTKIYPPEQDLTVINPTIKRIQWGNNFKYGNNWLIKDREGVYRMYVEGDDFERGYANGILTKELAQEQELYFVNEINKKIPSSFYQFILKVFIGWFNRDIDKHIPLEYKKEIYGVSLFASKEYSYIAPPYQRLLNYHAAHDIGHAVQNMHLVACTALGTWENSTSDSTMYIGRNFDFYVGDDFAKNKIIAFVNPKKGYPFMSVTWGGMIGVLSGMNLQGLTITLNADKSGMPSGTGTPVSIIAREILQYASTIDEAFAIAKKHKSFVSESFMIGSANDKKIAIIEKTPETTQLFYSNDSKIICANHFQSDSLNHTLLNIEDMKDSTSVYRQNRVQELLNAIPKMNEKEMARILRDQSGLKNQSIGMGNPKAINQLIAHHSIIFNPYKKLVWISTNPYQLGEYQAYNLDKIFKNPQNINEISDKSLTIPIDSFLLSKSYADFVFYKKTAVEISKGIKNDKNFNLTSQQIEDFIASNSKYYNVYLLIGEYFQQKENYKQAIKYYQQGLKRELPSVADRENIIKKISVCNEKLQKK